jgi:hypothetical protein
MLNLFPHFRFPLMFRYVHERHVAALRFDIEALQQSLANEVSRNDNCLALIDDLHDHAKSAQANHTAALKAMDAAYRKDKEQMARMFRSPAYHQELGYAILPFATFRQQEVSY